MEYLRKKMFENQIKKESGVREAIEFLKKNTYSSYD